MGLTTVPQLVTLLGRLWDLLTYDLTSRVRFLATGLKGDSHFWLYSVSRSVKKLPPQAPASMSGAVTSCLCLCRWSYPDHPEGLCPPRP